MHNTETAGKDIQKNAQQFIRNYPMVGIFVINTVGKLSLPLLNTNNIIANIVAPAPPYRYPYLHSCNHFPFFARSRKMI